MTCVTESDCARARSTNTSGEYDLIDEHRRPRLAVAEQVAEVAVAARPNLFEDESHPRDSYITVFRLFRSQPLAVVAGLLHFLPSGVLEHD